MSEERMLSHDELMEIRREYAYSNSSVDDVGNLLSHVLALEAQNAELVEALTEAIEDIESWAGYASDYFQEKHNLKGCLAAHRAALAKARGETA